MKGRTDAPLPLAQYSDMNTALAKRMEAHKAACAELAKDPLVALELTDREVARRVWANWKANAAKPVAPFEPTKSVKGYVFKRQAE